jgi:hypothetical protein
MRSFWSDPYLWVHLAGIATVPIWLELCMLGLAAGDPVLPVVLEWLLVGVVGIVPIVWMQWQRPFCIFCLIVLALKPQNLTEEQRRLLPVFRSQETRLLAVATGLVMAWVLWQLFGWAPLATDVAEIVPGGRLGGLLLAAFAFFFANLFLQVPVSVCRVLLVTDAQLATVQPYPVDRVRQDFLLLGLPVNQIIPPLQREQPQSQKPSAPPQPELSVPTRIEPESSDASATEPPPMDPSPGIEAETTPETDAIRLDTETTSSDAGTSRSEAGLDMEASQTEAASELAEEIARGIPEDTEFADETELPAVEQAPAVEAEAIAPAPQTVEFAESDIPDSAILSEEAHEASASGAVEAIAESTNTDAGETAPDLQEPPERPDNLEPAAEAVEATISPEPEMPPELYSTDSWLEENTEAIDVVAEESEGEEKNEA